MEILFGQDIVGKRHQVQQRFCSSGSTSHKADRRRVPSQRICLLHIAVVDNAPCSGDFSDVCRIFLLARLLVAECSVALQVRWLTHLSAILLDLHFTFLEKERDRHPVGIMLCMQTTCALSTQALTSLRHVLVERSTEA